MRRLLYTVAIAASMMAAPALADQSRLQHNALYSVDLPACLSGCQGEAICISYCNGFYFAVSRLPQSAFGTDYARYGDAITKPGDVLFSVGSAKGNVYLKLAGQRPQGHLYDMMEAAQPQPMTWAPTGTWVTPPGALYDRGMSDVLAKPFGSALFELPGADQQQRAIEQLLDGGGTAMVSFRDGEGRLQSRLLGHVPAQSAQELLQKYRFQPDAAAVVFAEPGAHQELLRAIEYATE